jgi:hypothetical protein
LFLAEHLGLPSEAGLSHRSLYRSRVALTALRSRDDTPGLAGGRRRGGLFVTVTPGSYRDHCVSVAGGRPPHGFHLPGRRPLASTAAVSVKTAQVLGFALGPIDRPSDDRALPLMPASAPRMLRGEDLASLGASLAEGPRREGSPPDPEGAWPEPPSSDGMHDKKLFAARAGFRAKESA